MKTLLFHVRVVSCGDTRRKFNIIDCDKGIFEVLTQIANGKISASA